MIKNNRKNKRELIKNSVRVYSISRIHKKYYSSMYDCIKHYKDWMFFNNELTHIEILPPSLNNIEKMKEYNMDFVVKGFRSLVEFKRYDDIRCDYGVSSMMFLSRSVGGLFIANALTRFMNGDSLPSTKDVLEEVDKHRIIDVDDSIEYKRMKEREKWKKKNEKYTIILHRMLFNMIRQKRVCMLQLLI